MRINVQNGTDKLVFVVYRYRNNEHLKDLNWNKEQLSTENFYMNERIPCATLTYFSSGALYWMKNLFKIETTLVNNGISLSIEPFQNQLVRKLSFDRESVRKTFNLNASRC